MAGLVDIGGGFSAALDRIGATEGVSPGLVEARPFDVGDLDLLTLQPEQQGEMVGRAGDWRAMIRDAAALGPAWTAWQADRVIGCGGFVLCWRGRATAWAAFADQISTEAWIDLSRTIQGLMRQVREIGVIRIEAEMVVGHEAGDQWLRHLGFEHEGVARCYGPDGQDFGRYAWVRP